MPKAKDYQEAFDLVNEVNLLSKKELESLFIGSKLYIEKFLFFPKTIVLFQGIIML